MYLYISTSSADVLAQRQKQRLSEADSTLAKRLAWAKQQVAKSSAAGLFDDIIANTSLAEVLGGRLAAAAGVCPVGIGLRCGAACAHNIGCLGAGLVDCADLAPAGLCSPEGGDQQAEPHHPQQVGGGMLSRGTVAQLPNCLLPRGQQQSCTLHDTCLVPHCNVCLCRLRGLPAYVLDYSDLIPPNRCVGASKCCFVLSATTEWRRHQSPAATP